MPLAAALALMKCARPAVSPNIGFLVRLLALERATLGSTSIPRRALALHAGYAWAFDTEADADAYIGGIVGAAYVATGSEHS